MFMFMHMLLHAHIESYRRDIPVSRRLFRTFCSLDTFLGYQVMYVHALTYYDKPVLSPRGPMPFSCFPLLGTQACGRVGQLEQRHPPASPLPCAVGQDTRKCSKPTQGLPTTPRFIFWHTLAPSIPLSQVWEKRWRESSSSPHLS